MPPAKPRLFISHSSRDPILTADVVSALATPTATHPGFDVLVDTDYLQAGGDWSDQLHAMMAYAHAGLLLFTDAAMNQPDWIRKEAYILTWRRSLDPNFQVFYAYRDGVTYDRLTKNGFEPAHLNLIQSLKATEPAAIAVEVKGYPAPASGTNTPFERLRRALSLHLKLGEDALGSLAVDLSAPPVIPWLKGSVDLGVGRIAERLLAGQFGTIQNLSTLINTLRELAMQKEFLSNVMRWVAPYWVAPEAVGRLAAVTDELWRQKTGGIAAINGKSVVQYTAKMFVYKTQPFKFECRVAEVESGTHSGDADYYTGAICAWLRRRELQEPYERRYAYSDDDNELLDQLKGRSPFLFVPIKTPDPETLEALRVRFPTVVFLLWTGPKLDLTDYDLPVVLLEPPVDGDRETHEYNQWATALGALGN